MINQSRAYSTILTKLTAILIVKQIWIARALNIMMILEEEVEIKGKVTFQL